MSPAPPPEMTRTGARSPRATVACKKAREASVDSVAPGSTESRTGLPSVVIPQATSTGARVHLEVAAVEKQVLELDTGEIADLEGVELDLDGLANPTHGRLRHLGRGPERLLQGGLDVSGGQAPHPPGDHERLDGVGACHAPTEQARRERRGACAQLRTLQGHRPGCRLDRERAVAVARPLLRRLGLLPALVAIAAEEPRSVPPGAVTAHTWLASRPPPAARQSIVSGASGEPWRRCPPERSCLAPGPLERDRAL